MQKNNIIIKTALAIIAAVLTTGCIFEKMDMPEDLQDVMILLDVSTDAMQTKSTPTESESAINTLHIYAFCNDKPAGYMERQATQQNEPFFMHLLLPAVVSGGTDANTHNVEFYLVANAASMLYENNPVVLSENTTKSELNAMKFTGVAQNSPLPLYCNVTEALNVADYVENMEAGHEGHICLNKEISFTLTRPLAKLSVYAARSADVNTSPQIHSVTMLAGGTREYNYLLPQDADVLNAVPSMVSDRRLLSTAVSVGALSGSADNIDGYTAVITDPFYISEVTYGSDVWNVAPSVRDKAAVLVIDYSLNPGSAQKTVNVYLPPIVRNNHYKVLCLINENDEGSIIIKLSVADWDDHTINNFVFDYPTHSYLRQSIPASDSENAQKPSSAAVMSESAAFTGYFQMTAPDSDEWTPTLIGSHASDAEVKVYIRNDNNTYTEVGTPIPAGNQWYRIEVKPDTGFPVGESVNLAVTYTATGGFTQSEYLLINGSSGEYYWPGSSDANFVTITMR